ncbi:retrovirus-related pol polyprotein [Lentinula edodes]|uniref:Retrovirus-related pol polyprotein n=1 Tax=Lentinula edodes TaxID=5353 RepID=A0A1Q3ETM5_LENED|nr:retrovirus-related pol polyprotein [Lentinula edodes]
MSGYIFTMAGGLVCWSSKCQATVALLTIEAEYVSLTCTAQQLKWTHSWMEKVGLPQEKPGILKGDNQSAVSLTMNTCNHGKVKHIDIWEHYIRELIQSGEIDVEFIRGNANAADIFTKPLPHDAHYHYLSELNILPTWALLSGGVLEVTCAP